MEAGKVCAAIMLRPQDVDFLRLPEETHNLAANFPNCFGNISQSIREGILMRVGSESRKLLSIFRIKEKKHDYDFFRCVHS